MSIQPRTPDELPTDVNQRTIKALSEPMLVVEDHPDAWSEHEVVVYNADREHLVNVDVGHCDCADVKYRGVRCKHLRRADYALGRKDIPAWINRDGLDDQLRRRLEERDA